jgi:hypothetical protein
MVLRLVAIALAAYGVYHAVYAITMVPVAVSPLLLLAFVLQAVFAILAAVGVWRAQRWAATALLLLGASIAATVLIEAFVSASSLAACTADRDCGNRIALLLGAREPLGPTADDPARGHMSILPVRTNRGVSRRASRESPRQSAAH